MNRIIKNFLILTLMFCISLPAMAGEFIKLDLKTAVQLARQHNLDLKIAALNLEKAELEYDRKKASNLLTKSHYFELEAEYSFSAAENTYQTNENDLVFNMIKQYTELWLAGIDIQVTEKRVEVEKGLLEDTKAQYELGDKGDIDLLEQENAYQDARFELETARDDYQQKMREFKTYLALGEDTVQLKELLYPESWQISEKEALTAAMKNNIDLQLKEDRLKLARIDLDRAEVSSSVLDKKIKEVVLETARLEKENTIEKISNSVREKYYQFKQAVKNMKLKKERLTEAEEKYRLIKGQFTLGLTTEIDILQYEINMMQANYQYQAAIASYFLQEQALRQAMNLEIGVFRYEATK